MELKLVLIEKGETDFNGKHYKIYNFVDPSSLTIVRGVNLPDNLEVEKSYTCHLILKGGKLKVDSVKL